jgi:uncharacterized membrane protein
MHSIWWQRIAQSEWGLLVLWLAVLAILVAVAAYVITKVRSQPIQNERSASELLSKFRESHCRGELSDAEFRTIRTTLAAQVQEELRDDDQTA